LIAIPWQGFLKDKGGREFTTTYLSLPQKHHFHNYAFTSFQQYKTCNEYITTFKKNSNNSLTNSIEGFKESNERGLT